MRLLALAAAAAALGGCVAKDIVETAVDVASLPVKVASAGVDAATTSQSEADEKRGRELRKADEKRARDEREAAKKAAGRPQSE
ncbi:MAG TPA: hypothetical protein VFS45_01590 [Sphingomicrobium sp.]|nr:hypothetical protein [Sphingomicrobium sp.]